MKNQEFADKIKEDVSKIYDVRHWTFFFKPNGYLEFYESNPILNWVLNSDFKDYEDEIDMIARRIIHFKGNHI